jgi:putative DNA primase/helicase
MTAAHAAPPTSRRATASLAAGDPTSAPVDFDDLDLEGLPQVCQALRSPEFLAFLRSEPLRFNQLAHVPCVGSLPLLSRDPERVREAFCRYLALHEKGEWRGTPANVVSAISVVAREQPFHPVADYLGKLGWDGKRRLERVAVEVLDVEPDASEAASQLVRKWCLSAVARAFQPGTPVEGVLVLVGGGRLPTDLFFRMLIPPGLYVDLPAESPDMTRLQLRRAWVYALPDIAKCTGVAGETTLASFLDELEDEVDSPFAVPGERAPRTTVFAAMADDLPMVTNPGLAHHLWGVPVGMNLNADKLVSWRDQLWAEAVCEFRAGASWLLTPEDDRRRSRLALGLSRSDPWEAPIFAFMKEHAQPRIHEVLGFVFTALHGFDHGTTEWPMREQRRAGAVLKSLGYVARQSRAGGERHTCWVPSEPGKSRNEGSQGGR